MKKLTAFLSIMLLVSSCAVRSRKASEMVTVVEESYFAGWLIRLDDRKEASFADCATGIRFPIVTDSGYKDIVSGYRERKPEGCEAVFAEFRGQLVKENSRRSRRPLWNGNSLSVRIIEPVAFSRYADCNKEFMVPGIYTVADHNGTTEIRLKPDYTYTASNFSGERTVWDSYGRWNLESMNDLVLRPEVPYGAGIDDIGSVSRPELSQPAIHPLWLEIDPSAETITRKNGSAVTVFSKVYIR